MNDLHTWDAVAIDTNVFEHIFNDCENTDLHINDLLKNLQKNQTKLLVDSKSRIVKEYRTRIGRRLSNSVYLDEVHILRYWLASQATQKEVDVDEPSDLMNAIKGVIHEPKSNVDRTFVYVAFSQGKNLISNDEEHIVIGPEPEWGQRDRRLRLKKSVRNICKPSRQSEIMTSMEAHVRVKTDLQNQKNSNPSPHQ